MFLLDEFVFLITKDEEALMDTETDTESTWMIKYNYYYAPAAVVRLVDLVSTWVILGQNDSQLWND